MWFASASLPSCISHDTRLDFLPASSWVRVMLVVILYAHRSIAVFTVPGFVLSLSWLNNVTAGHTKKVGILHVIEIPKWKPICRLLLTPPYSRLTALATQLAPWCGRHNINRGRSFHCTVRRKDNQYWTVTTSHGLWSAHATSPAHYSSLLSVPFSSERIESVMQSLLMMEKNMLSSESQRMGSVWKSKLTRCVLRIGDWFSCAMLIFCPH